MTMIPRIGVALALAAVLPTVAQSQQYFPEGNGAALRGVTSFDARFVADAWLEVEGDEARFEARGEAAFERGVRAVGVNVATDAPNYLFCVVSVAQRDGIVFYNYAVDYHLFRDEGLQPLEWSGGGVASIGSGDFTAEEAASDCVETFARAWREHNPGDGRP